MQQAILCGDKTFLWYRLVVRTGGIAGSNRGSIPLTIATFGKVTALVCKTNLLQQIAVLDLAVSGFESHPSHQNGIAGFLFGKQGWHLSVILQIPFYAELVQR